MDRDLLLVAFDLTPAGALACRCVMPFAAGTEGRQTTLLDALNTAMRSQDMASRVSQMGAAAPTTFRSAIPLLADGDVLIYSWRRTRLRSELLAVSAPMPGVVICLVRPLNYAGVWPPPNVDIEMAIGLARGAIDLNPNDQFSPVRDFLRSADAHAPPIKPRSWDVFLSHATEDASLAREISATLTDVGLRVFLAEMSVRPGALWSEEIRRALTETCAALVLLTPNSVKSQWVMAELGALWALDISFIPATVFVNADDLPEFVTRRQCVEVLTADGKAQCISALRRLCAAPGE